LGNSRGQPRYAVSLPPRLQAIQKIRRINHYASLKANGTPRRKRWQRTYRT
jgi:hypothetical protein